MAGRTTPCPHGRPCPDGRLCACSDITVADTLTSGSHPGSNMPGRRREDDTNLVPYTFDWQAGGGGNDQSFRGKSRAWIDDKPGTARSLVKNKTLAVHDHAAVRRLTPVECERLQGLPDGWTQVPDIAPDSRRYAGLGDAVTANVGEWIGRRLLAVEAMYAKAAA